MSPDDIPTHRRFAASLRLRFPLLSDGDKRVAAAYDAVALGGAFFDRKTFIIDKTGIIRYVRRGFPSMDDLVTVLRQLHSSSLSQGRGRG